MSTAGLRFKEIEHKYVVGDEFDLESCRTVLATLGLVRTTSIRVRDDYYLTEGGQRRRFLVRHRFDAELHQLTIKTLEVDAEVRDEVNLDLGQQAGDQGAQVEAFMACLGISWRGTVHKDVEVWYFPDCEVVYYRAWTDSRSIRCVEFEARGGTSVAEALAIVERFERATGFDCQVREHRSLPQLLFPELADRLAGA
ncbi:MAG: CYTH domain-containing protein [Vicinamibacterales bacterium]